MTRFITRRTILKSTLALPLASIAVPPRRARATTLSGIMATYFNGSSAIQNDGTVQGFPTAAGDLFISYCYSSNLNTGPFTHHIINQAPTSQNPQVIQVVHQSVTSKRNSTYLYLAFTGGNFTTSLVGRSTAGTLPSDGLYHKVFIQANAGTGLLRAYLDAGPLAGFSVVDTTGGPCTITYYQTPSG